MNLSIVAKHFQFAFATRRWYDIHDDEMRAPFIRILLGRRHCFDIDGDKVPKAQYRDITKIAEVILYGPRTREVLTLAEFVRRSKERDGIAEAGK